MGSPLMYHDPSLNIRIEHLTLNHLFGAELRDYWHNVARDTNNLKYLRYRNSTGKLEMRDGCLYGIFDGRETRIDCRNAQFISSTTTGSTKQAIFKAYLNGELVATRSRKVLDCPNINNVYRTVVESLRKKSDIDTLEVFISPFTTDYRNSPKGK